MASENNNEAPINWQSGDQTGFATVNGHKLYLQGSGPKRATAHTPVVIIEHGLGGSLAEWRPAMALIAKFARVYGYSRAGYHPSERPTQPPTPANIAADLRALLLAADIPPPYVLVGHSYGGTLVREFLAQYGAEVVHGMVIKDAPPQTFGFPENWPSLLDGSTYQDVVGIAANHAFATNEEFQEMIRADEINEAKGGIIEAEKQLSEKAMSELWERTRGKQLLGSGPLSVIFCNTANDFRKMYEYAERHGTGTIEAREALGGCLEEFAAFDERNMRDFLTLSSNSRFVIAQGKAATHNSHLVVPSLVADEVEWVYRQLV